ncbi:hypothetical protein CERSUDRAFT_158929, partial [Gelatoporia subvermispora B]
MSVVVCATSFLLGLLFTHWIADSLTLWKSPPTQTDARLWASAAYYSILSRTPPALAYLHAAVAALGASTIAWSLGDGRAGNLMFDGGSICESAHIASCHGPELIRRAVLYGTAIFVYLNSVVPNLFANFTTLPLPFASQITSQAPPLPPFPPSLRTPILDIASAHLICSVVLTGVLILQAGRWWAEQADIDGDETEGEEDTREGEAEPDSDKKQRATGGADEEADARAQESEQERTRRRRKAGAGEAR